MMCQRHETRNQYKSRHPGINSQIWSSPCRLLYEDHGYVSESLSEATWSAHRARYSPNFKKLQLVGPGLTNTMLRRLRLPNRLSFWNNTVPQTWSPHIFTHAVCHMKSTGDDTQHDPNNYKMQISISRTPKHTSQGTTRSPSAIRTHCNMKVSR